MATPTKSTTTVTINSKEYADGMWRLNCVVTDTKTTRSGVVAVELPEDASDSDLMNAAAALYA